MPHTLFYRKDVYTTNNRIKKVLAVSGPKKSNKRPVGRFEVFSQRESHPTVNITLTLYAVAVYIVQYNMMLIYCLLYTSDYSLYFNSDHIISSY